MANSTMTPAPVKPCCCKLHLTIGATTYAVKPIPCDPCLGTRAFRLRKDDGTVYDILQGEYGPECDCPDFTFRGDGRPCKHLRAMAACGLVELPELAPVAPPADPEAPLPESPDDGLTWEPRPEPKPESEPTPAPVDALAWATAISETLWAVATEEQRDQARYLLNRDGLLGVRFVPPGPSLEELRRRLAAATPRERTIRVETDGAEATMERLGWSRAGGRCFEKRVAERGTGLSDYDARRWNR